MNILVINCGSSSLKYQLIDSLTEKATAKGICERIGMAGSQIKHAAQSKNEIIIEGKMDTHQEAVQYVLRALQDLTHGVIKSLDEISAIGHRVVHGGEEFQKSTIIDDKVLEAIEACNDLAPLHNPANIIGINACMSLMPNVPNIAVFDTAFHQTMPQKAYLYGLPYEYYEKYKIRRYGFHGTSHSYVSKKAAEFLGKNVEDLKTIVCHLGNGASICAVNGGKSVDTSMGLTPLEGLIMGTRSGDIDPAIVDFIAQKENLTLKEVMDVLNKKSGVHGMSGVSSDFRDLTKAIEEGNDKAKAAMDSFAYRIAKYVGSYATAMNGVDVIAFTAGIGENSSNIRKSVCEYLGYLGIEISDEANAVRGQENVVSTEASKIKVLVIPTNEELTIARETKTLVS